MTIADDVMAQVDELARDLATAQAMIQERDGGHAYALGAAYRERAIPVIELIHKRYPELSPPDVLRIWRDAQQAAGCIVDRPNGGEPMTTTTQLPREAIDARVMWDWHVELIEALARERRDAWEIITRHGPLNHDRIHAEHTVSLIDRVTKAAHADSLLWSVTQRLEKESQP